MGLPSSHVAGIPIEETVAMYGSVLLVVLSVAWAAVGIRVRRLREGRRAGRRRE
jgi:hypothetical protein